MNSDQPVLRTELYDKRLHYPTAYRWWRARREFGLDLEILGSQGVVVCEAEVPLAMSWLYASDSKCAQIGWSLTNPEAPMRLRAQAARSCITTLMAMAKEQGYTRLITFSSSGGLTREFEQQGFTRLVAHDVLVRSL